MKQSFKNESLNFLATLCMQNENKRFPLQERYTANLGILDSVADKDLTKDPSAIANVKNGY